MTTTVEPETELRLPAEDEPLLMTAGELRALIEDGATGWGAPEGTAEVMAAEVCRELRRMHAAEFTRRAATRAVADIQSRAVRWLWQDRIPYGMLSELCGDPGEGKSHVTLAMATAVTLGTPLPGEPPDHSRERGHVLLVCMEDSPEYVVRPRLESMGADLTRVTILDGIRDADGSGDAAPLDLSRVDHRAELRRLVEDLGVQLLVIDPITAHLGGANEWKDSEVRSVLAPLAGMADATGTAVLIVRHLRKSESSRAIYRAGGSIAFTASVRSSLMVGRPEGEEERRAIVRPKGNLSPEPPAVGYTLGSEGFLWTEGGDWTAADLLGGDTSSEERTERDEAGEYLRAALEDGSRPAREMQSEARKLGISDRTLRRARQDLGVKVSREGAVGSGQRWVWTLPEVATGDGRLDTATPGGHLDEAKSGQGLSGGSVPRGGHDPHVYGQLATSDTSDPPTELPDLLPEGGP